MEKEDKAGTIKNGKTATFSSSEASNSKKNQKMAQYNADARLLAEFEQTGESGMSFNYSKSVKGEPLNASEEQMTAYLSRIQRGGLIQPFGCMLAIEEPSFRIISYSENCFDMIGLKINNLSLFGVDARSLFTSASRDSLTRAISFKEISLLNPLWLHSATTHKPFCAILHRIDVGIVIDLEPAGSSDPASLLAGAVQSQKLAVRAISRLQALPAGDIGALCDTVVEDVQKLTGYDRVMVYKFHEEDEHGEVVSEIRRSDLEPYLGLHYPATDIPQAARFLFKQNRVRIIYSCTANPVQVIQTKELTQPLCLVNSTLRAPHSCHLQYMSNMGSIASLVMAIIINNNNDSTRLWGLVVCHHTSPRFVAFPLRYACQFLMQAFGLQLYMELQLASQLAEKKILRMQTLLCDMLLRSAPLGIVTQSPSIMDLVKCDGAALYYDGKCWLLGITPTESQVKEIAEWVANTHGDSTGLSTDSLANAGYEGASLLGDAVCGMAMARITSTDFLFWFRSHTAKEIKWGGAKHHHDDKDDDGRMNPRASFRAFLEVAKSKSLPWEVSEINAIHSLQLILRDPFQEIKDNNNIAVISGCDMGELSSMACEMVRLIETATAPIFGVDSSGLVNGWNSKMGELTGLVASEAMGKSFLDDIIHKSSRVAVESLLSRAFQGEEDKNVELKLPKFGSDKQDEVVYIVANACTSKDYSNNVIGVCFVGQDITSEKIVMDKFVRLQGDYNAIIQSINPLIPPIFASDENACCSEWNPGMEKLTGWKRDEIIGKLLPGEIFGGICLLKGQDSLTKFMILLYRAISGHDTARIPFGFVERSGKFVEVLLTANKRTADGGTILGCFCFLQILEPDLRLSVGERGDEKETLKELAYIRQEIKNPLNGIRFTHKLLEGTAISDDQKQFLETSNACERQIMSIIEDMDLGNLENGVELKVEEFLLENLLDAIVSQVMTILNEKKLQLLHEIPAEIKTLYLYGDQIKLQLVLSNFLLNIARYAPSPDGWVEIKVTDGIKLIQDGNDLIHLQFRITHPGQGLPAALIEEMIGDTNKWATHEGISLNLSRKLLRKMNGHVEYVRKQTKCYFLVNLELKTKI